MSYTSFAYAGKSPVKAEDIGPGQIQLSHLSPALFTEFKKVGLHNHSGSGSRKLNLSDLEGSFLVQGFMMTASDGSRWMVTIDTSGVLTTTLVT